MFNPLSLSPFFFNPGVSHQTDNQNSLAARSSSPDRTVENSPGSVAPSRQSYSLSERFYRDDSFSIKLMTQDGDQVEITFNSETNYKSDYDLRSGHGREHQRYSIEKNQSSEFGFTVEGDLDVEEIDAIAALVQDLSSLANSFFDGDLQTAMQQVGDLSFDTGQLAQLDVSMEQSIEYRAIEKYREIQTMGDRGEFRFERAVEPFMEQLQNQLSRSEQLIQYATEFTFGLFAELVTHDLRYNEMSDTEQDSLKDYTQRLVELASVKANEVEEVSEDLEHENENDSDGI